MTLASSIVRLLGCQFLAIFDVAKNSNISKRIKGFQFVQPLSIYPLAKFPRNIHWN